MNTCKGTWSSIRTWLAAAIIAVALTAIFIPLQSEAAEEPQTVRIYVTVSDDSEFVQGNDLNATVLARVPLDVPYVDLKDYDLDEFYRYEAKPFDEGGEYTDEKVLVERPTLLMAILRLTGDYYLGSDISRDDIGTDALKITGSGMHLFMERFWGHDQNLMYYVNHAFPRMSASTGATADYILLEQGDEIDIAMFSDWDVPRIGAFAFFEDAGSVTAKAGQPLHLNLKSVSTQEQEPGQEAPALPMPEEPIRISDDGGHTWSHEEGYVTDENGKVTVTFSEPGTYIISAGPHYAYQDTIGTTAACVAPPVCIATVKGEQKQEDDPGDPEEERVDPAKKARASEGKTYQTGGSTYKVAKTATAENAGTVTLTRAKNVKSFTVPKTIKLADGRVYRVTQTGAKAFAGKKIRTVTIGANVLRLGKKTFAKSKVSGIVIKSRLLKKGSVKGCLKESKVKTIKVRVGSKKMNRKFVKRYKKIFTRKNAGKSIVMK